MCVWGGIPGKEGRWGEVDEGEIVARVYYLREESVFNKN